MNIVQRLDQALEPMNIPFYPGFYAGDGEEYGTYEDITEDPDLFGDNLPETEIVSGVINLFVKTEKHKKKNKCKSLLRKAGFFVGSTYEQYESSTGYTHYSIEFEKIQNIKEE